MGYVYYYFLIILKFLDSQHQSMHIARPLMPKQFCPLNRIHSMYQKNTFWFKVLHPYWFWFLSFFIKSIEQEKVVRNVIQWDDTEMQGV